MQRTPPAPAIVLFVGGGSVGHIAPGVAVAQALRRMQPDTAAHFLCSSRPGDARYLAQEGLPYTVIDAPRLGVAFLWRFPMACIHARRTLRHHRPGAVFATGGYVSVPVCLMAALLGIPIILHEPDAGGGWATRCIARIARAITLGFPPQTPYGPRYHVTGNPLREGICAGNRTQGLRTTGLTGERPILLVMGGSLGAQRINDAVEAQYAALHEFCDIVHLTGPGKDPTVSAREGYWSAPFVTEELPHLYAIADLALSRAGATSVTELIACGIPTILVPLRVVARDLQERNARRVEQRGACTVLQQDDLPKLLTETVRTYLEDSAKREQMQTAQEALRYKNASGQIAEIISSCLAQTRQHP